MNRRIVTDTIAYVKYCNSKLKTVVGVFIVIPDSALTSQGLGMHTKGKHPVYIVDLHIYQTKRSFCLLLTHNN